MTMPFGINSGSTPSKYRARGARRSGLYAAQTQARSRMSRGLGQPALTSRMGVGSQMAGSAVAGRGRNTTPGTPRGSYSATVQSAGPARGPLGMKQSNSAGKYKRPGKKALKAQAAQSASKARAGLAGGLGAYGSIGSR
jgi:hypothetical protein